MNRYRNQRNVINSSAYYQDILNNKNIKTIRHKNVYNFEVIKKNFTNEIFSSILYTWKSTDKLYNVSEFFYKNPNYGWLILFLNKKSSEMELTEGTPLQIYLPLDRILKGA
jgi:hypothetical protein